VKINRQNYVSVVDDLLCCDWLGRVRLIITRAVRRLAIATLGMIGGDAFRGDCSASRVSRYLSVLFVVWIVSSCCVQYSLTCHVIGKSLLMQRMPCLNAVICHYFGSFRISPFARC